MPSKPPAFVKPQLATAGDAVPVGKDWIYEIKFDGYRVEIAALGAVVRCYTRNGLDWTRKFGGIPAAVAALALDGVLFDGEVVALDGRGHSDFSALQGALGFGGKGLSYMAFDLLAVGGKSLRDRSLTERKERLAELLGEPAEQGPVYYVDHVTGDGRAMYDRICREGMEGIVAKRGDRPYRSDRSADWIKVKCGVEGAFVVVGYTGARPTAFDALALAVLEEGRLRYVGRVGTGFSGRDFQRIGARLSALSRPDRTTANAPSPATAKRMRWIEPRMVARVRHHGWTADGRLRHASFLGVYEER